MKLNSRVFGHGILLVLTYFSFGCSEKKVKYSSVGKVEESVKPEKKPDPSKVESAPQELGQNTAKAMDSESKKEWEDDSELESPACHLFGEKQILVDMPNRFDRASYKLRKDDGYSFKDEDIRKSQVITFSLDEIKGDFLPVSEFELDDVAFIVKPSVDLNSILKYGANDARFISIPSDAILLHQGGLDSYAQGSIDSAGDTTYSYQGKDYFLKGGEPQKLRDLDALGFPTIAHDKISVSALKELGFLQAGNLLEFRIIHVAHGYGNLKINFEIPECK